MGDMEQKTSTSIDSVCRFLKGLFPGDLGRSVWLAGGSVRDTLLGREVRDIDLVAVLPSGHPESLGFTHVEGVTTTPIWFRHFHKFGNVELTVLDGIDSLAEDLNRRDFTLNAILMSLDGEVVDPLDAQPDLQRLLLKPCSEATFLNDPIRIFRAFRFEAEGFCLSREADALIRSRGWEEDLARMPVERFSREMLKAMQGNLPGRFFLRMAETGVGAGLLPELFRMQQIPAGPPEHHPEGDLFSHSLEVLARVSSVTGSPLGRFCAFYHDIGKLYTDPNLYPRHHGHDVAGFKIAEEFCRRLALPSQFGRALAWTSRLHGNANRFGELRPSTRIKMAQQAARAGIKDLLPLVSMADKPGNDIGAEWGVLLQIAMLKTADLGIEDRLLDSIKPEKREEFILQRRIEFLKTAGRAVISC